MLLFMCKYTLILLLSKGKVKIIIRNILNFQFKESRLIGSPTIAFQQIEIRTGHMNGK